MRRPQNLKKSHTGFDKTDGYWLAWFPINLYWQNLLKIKLYFHPKATSHTICFPIFVHEIKIIIKKVFSTIFLAPKPSLTILLIFVFFFSERQLFDLKLFKYTFLTGFLGFQCLQINNCLLLTLFWNFVLKYLSKMEQKTSKIMATLLQSSLRKCFRCQSG